MTLCRVRINGNVHKIILLKGKLAYLSLPTSGSVEKSIAIETGNPEKNRKSFWLLASKLTSTSDLRIHQAASPLVVHHILKILRRLQMTQLKDKNSRQFRCTHEKSCSNRIDDVISFRHCNLIGSEVYKIFAQQCGRDKSNTTIHMMSASLSKAYNEEIYIS